MPPSTERSNRLVSVASYSLLATVVLAPLAFWPSQYVALEAAKTFVIATGTLLSAFCFLLLASREKKITLPTRQIVWSGAALVVSIIASAIASDHFMKSFFGQGFELGSGSFILVLIVSSLVAFWAVCRRPEKIILLYAGVVGSFLVLATIHGIRFLTGPEFASLGILNQITSSLAGNWYAFAIYAALVGIIAIMAVMFLPLSPRMRHAYRALIAVSALFSFLINSSVVWKAGALVFLGLAIYMTLEKRRQLPGQSLVKSLAWMPLVIFVICTIFVYKGQEIAGPVIQKMGTGYAEISLPWRMTLDVAAGELKQSPLFGSGPNRFSQSFLSNKPVVINSTDAWAVEFNSGFGLVPTFFVTQGFLGVIVWVTFFVMLGLAGARSLRGLLSRSVQADAPGSDNPYAKFALISSYSAAVFLWIVSIIYVPSHAVFYMAFVMTGIWLGAAATYGRLKSLDLTARPLADKPGETCWRFPAYLIALAVIALLWGIISIKNIIALGYFGKAVSELTVDGNPDLADKHFRTALALNPIDVYWQARVEAAIVKASQLANAASVATNDASRDEAVVAASESVNQALSYAESAIASDPSNYYNYASAARVAEAATSLGMENSYEAGVEAYLSAISINPGNPALYVNLARFQANHSQFDEAIQTIGAALRVRNNHLDAVFLLAQVSAAKGELADAIQASQFAIQLDPQSPLLHFQLGLFQYTAGNYAAAAEPLAEAVRLQPDYANARYFLGLSEARLGNITNATVQFELLASSNPENAEVALILSNLKAGRSPFTGATAPITNDPQNRPNPPIDENN